VTILLPGFNLKKYVRSPWTFYLNNRSELSSTFDTIIGQDLLGEVSIFIYSNDYTVTWDTDTILKKDRDTALYHN
jgi:hypothetical protein